MAIAGVVGMPESEHGCPARPAGNRTGTGAFRLRSRVLSAMDGQIFLGHRRSGVVSEDLAGDRVTVGVVAEQGLIRLLQGVAIDLLRPPVGVLVRTREENPVLVVLVPG